MWVDMLPHVLRLFARSKLEHHRTMTLSEVVRKIIPPLERGYYAHIFLDGELRAFASWGFFSDEAAKKWKGAGYIQPQDWNSGPNIWLVDVIAEDDLALPLIRHVKKYGETTCKGRYVHFRREQTGRYGAVKL